jgi:hypothetical protein
MVLTVYGVLTPERLGLVVSVTCEMSGVSGPQGPTSPVRKLGTCHLGARPARFGRPPTRRPSSKRIRVHRIPPRVS